jgi:hypothetical protein
MGNGNREIESLLFMVHVTFSPEQIEHIICRFSLFGGSL